MVERAARPEERKLELVTPAGPAPPGGRAGPPVLAAGTHELGVRRHHATCRASRAGPRGRGSRSCRCCRSTRPRRSTPAPTRRSAPSRWTRSSWGWTPARTSRRPGGREALPAELRRELEDAGGTSPAVDWPRVRKLKRLAARLAFERFLRDEWKPRNPAGPAARLVHERAPGLAGRLRPLHRHPRASWARAGWSGRAACASARPTPSRRSGASTTRTLLERAWLQWQLDGQWHQARAEAARVGVSLMGDLPFTVAMDSADVWSQPDAFRVDLRVGTPPEEGAPDGPGLGPAGLRLGPPAAQRVRLGPGPGRPGGLALLGLPGRPRHRLLPELRAQRDASPQGWFWPAHESAQISLGETILRIMRTSGEVIAEDLGALPPFLRPSLERLNVPGLPGAALGEGRRHLPRSGELAQAVGGHQRHPRHDHHRRSGTTRCPARSGWRCPALPGLEEPGHPGAVRRRGPGPAAVAAVPGALAAGHRPLPGSVRPPRADQRPRHGRREQLELPPADGHRAAGGGCGRPSSGCPAWPGRAAGRAERRDRQSTAREGTPWQRQSENGRGTTAGEVGRGGAGPLRAGGGPAGLRPRPQELPAGGAVLGRRRGSDGGWASSTGCAGAALRALRRVPGAAARSTPSTSPCPTTCTRTSRCGRPGPACTCCAKSRWP